MTCGKYCAKSWLKDELMQLPDSVRSPRVSSLLLKVREIGLGPWLLCFYLALAPVHYLPGIQEDVLRGAKLMLFSVAIGLVLIPAIWERQLRLPSGLLGIWGFAALVIFSLPGLVQTPKLTEILGFAIDIAAVASLFWCFFHIAASGNDAEAILRRAFVVFGGIVAIVVVFALIEVPDWTTPCERLAASAYRGLTGNKGTSNGWSISIAFYLPIGVLFYRSLQRGRWDRWGISAIVLAGAMLLSQFHSSGRVGMLVSFVVVVVFVIVRRSKALIAWVALCGFLGIVALSDQSCYKYMKLHHIWNPFEEPIEEPIEKHKIDLEQFTTHRISGFRAGLDYLITRPLTGHGFKQVFVEGRPGKMIEPHNFYLRWAVSAGILAPLWFLVMMGMMLRNLTHAARHADLASREAIVVTGLIFIAGFIVSLFEGNVPVGSFQTAAIWWAAVGCFVGRHWRLCYPSADRLSP